MGTHLGVIIWPPEGQFGHFWPENAHAFGPETLQTRCSNTQASQKHRSVFDIFTLLEPR